MAVAGVAFEPKFQLQEVALLDKSEKVILLPVQVVVALAVKSANVAAQKLELETIFKVSLEEEQTPLLIVQSKVVVVLFVNELAVLVGEAVFAIEQLPLKIV